MISVLFVAMIVLGMAAVTVNYVVNTLPQTRNHEDWNAAFAAAEAGVDDVIARLNQNPAYWQADDPDNPARDGWRPLAGGDPRAEYHYHLDSSDLGRTGFVDVVSTGRVGTQQRTVHARVRREGFLDYVYFTDIDGPDPYLRFAPGSHREHMDEVCREYRPGRNTAWSGGCGSIVFPGIDIIDGPLRTNDAILTRPYDDGPFFLGPVIVGSTFDAAGNLFGRTGTGAGPTFAQGIRQEPRLPLPETAADVSAAAAATGCVYRGPTYLRFEGADVTVVSPLTDPADVNPWCGEMVGAHGGLHDTITLPDREAIFIVGSDQAPSAHPLGMPRDGDNRSQFSNNAGDAYVHGEVAGQLTVGTENNLYIVEDLTLADDSFESDEIIGLIAEQHVFVYHPVAHPGGGATTFEATNLPVSGPDLPPFNIAPDNPFTTERVWVDPEIHAAILALNRSFAVMNHQYGPRLGERGQDTLTVYGNIAQQFRGSVGGGQDESGYDKDYRYDPRFQFMSPPFFSEPPRSPWGVRVLSEIAAPATCGSGEEPRVDRCLPA